MRRRAAIALAVLAASPAAAQDAVVTGELTRADYETYREVPFDVPAGVGRITVRLEYDRADKTVVDLGLWDTERFRGWSGGRRDRFTVAPSDATPGYLPGALPAGRWKVVLGVPNIRDGVRAKYRVSVWFDRGESQAATAAIADAPLRTGPGWYRGDLHMHDANSDGSCAPLGGGERQPCPLFRTVAAAQAAGLDFIAVTDHNTTSHFNGLRELQAYHDRMLLIPGVEITTFHGHANVFAPTRFVDFRLATQRGIGALQDEVAAAGAIMSVNHPSLPSGELCMGCGWTWPGTDWKQIVAIEAINGVNATGPLSGMRFWYDRLNEGYRLTGIGGSDNHDPDAIPGQSPVGRPTTVVHAAALSTPAILAGIRAGNVFIDVEGTRDRLLELTARQGDSVVAMGGTLHARAAITVEARVRGAAGTVAELVVDGRIAPRPVTLAGADALARFTLPARTGQRWFALRVMRGDQPLLLGSPVYLD